MDWRISFGNRASTRKLRSSVNEPYTFGNRHCQHNILRLPPPLICWADSLMNKATMSKPNCPFNTLYISVSKHWTRNIHTLPLPCTTWGHYIKMKGREGMSRPHPYLSERCVFGSRHVVLGTRRLPGRSITWAFSMESKRTMN